jgi:hypothetical protein
MGGYKVVYEIGGRLFRANRTFQDIESAKLLSDYFLRKSFDAGVFPEEVEHDMRSGFSCFLKMVSANYISQLERPKPFDQIT